MKYLTELFPNSVIHLQILQNRIIVNIIYKRYFLMIPNMHRLVPFPRIRAEM